MTQSPLAPSCARSTTLRSSALVLNYAASSSSSSSSFLAGEGCREDLVELEFAHGQLLEHLTNRPVFARQGHVSRIADTQQVNLLVEAAVFIGVIEAEVGLSESQRGPKRGRSGTCPCLRKPRWSLAIIRGQCDGAQVGRQFLPTVQGASFAQDPSINQPLAGHALDLALELAHERAGPL